MGSGDQFRAGGKEGRIQKEGGSSRKLGMVEGGMIT
jgi:hypothetical protein